MSWEKGDGGVTNELYALAHFFNKNMNQTSYVQEKMAMNTLSQKTGSDHDK